MEQQQSEYLDKFEQSVTERLIEQMTGERLLGGYCFAVEELSQLWHRCAPDYMVDAVPQIAQYPVAAIAWAAYFGIGAAVLWDRQEIVEEENLYQRLRDARGFDDMDEYVNYLLLKGGFSQQEVERLENALRSCAQSVLTAIRKEDIEPQSVMAFHIFARSVKVMFHLGMSMAMHLMGFSYEKARVELPS